MVSKSRTSVITNVPPSFAQKTFGILESMDIIESWLEAKRKDDDVEDGLWRINNTLYDVTDFIDKHPGGSDWLRFTKGHDITEAFLTHHLNLEKVEPYLKKYGIRDTTKPRNVKLTFDEDGFYMTLQRKVVQKLPEIKKSTKILSKYYIDTLFALTILSAILANRFQSIGIALFCALVYTWCGISGHNFLHLRDNFRMKYFNILFMSYRDWRVSHALSHHCYPNSLIDIELVALEPFLLWTIDGNKSWFHRYASYVYSPFIYCIYYQMQFVKKIYAIIFKGSAVYLDEFFPFIVPLLMYLFSGNNSFWDTFKMQQLIVVMASFIFGIVAINAGHHHPEVLHDGDKVRDGLDWGIYTVDTLMDRQELRGNALLALTNFGDHALHHLFPTLDHGLLPSLYDIFFETLIEFEAECQCYSWFFETIKGQFLQLSRTEPMTICSHERYLTSIGQKSKLVNGKPAKKEKEN